MKITSLSIPRSPFLIRSFVVSKNSISAPFFLSWLHFYIKKGSTKQLLFLLEQPHVYYVSIIACVILCHFYVTWKNLALYKFTLLQLNNAWLLSKKYHFPWVKESKVVSGWNVWQKRRAKISYRTNSLDFWFIWIANSFFSPFFHTAKVITFSNRVINFSTYAENCDLFLFLTDSTSAIPRIFFFEASAFSPGIVNWFISISVIKQHLLLQSTIFHPSESAFLKQI